MKLVHVTTVSVNRNQGKSNDLPLCDGNEEILVTDLSVNFLLTVEWFLFTVSSVAIFAELYQGD